MTARLPPGRPYPLGVTPEGDGVNVAVVSRHAERIEICLLDHEGRETARHALPERTGDVHHGFVPGLAAGQAYGLRAHGEWAPERGHRFNPAKLLIDPYARALTGTMRWEGPNLVDPTDPFRRDPRDSAPFVPRSVVTAPLQPQAALEPATPWDRTVLYEAHVKGLTRLHPAVPEAARGRFAGLAHPAVLEHLVRLGVTAVELLPIAAFLDELRLVRLGLRNYWGYNPIAFMAPHGAYAATDPMAEFRAMVRALHGAGLEVILDVVFNHTAESDHLGPILSLRGLDDALYYRHDPERPGRYLDWAGCGNVLDFGRPKVVQLAMDSLRHWAAMGVDGFRFDLGTILARDTSGAFDADAPFLVALRQDPQLAGLKLVMEPWDIGPGGYRPGGFPAPLAEWNDAFRTTVRRFWRGDEALLPGLATRLLGSADRYDHGHRPAWTGVNYVASHDGLPTADLVAYAGKHNEANGENNRDGSADEHGANYGAEGPSDDPAIHGLRLRQRRNLLATLLLSQGTPMLLMGDELGRSQKGNTNAYCQDNATSWLDWRRLDDPDERAFQAFVGRLVALRRVHPALRRRHFLHAALEDGGDGPTVAWLAASGRPMTPADWHDASCRSLGLLLAGAGDPTLLLLLNAATEPVPVRLPPSPACSGFRLLLDTTDAARGGITYPAGAAVILPKRALWLLEAAALSPSTAEPLLALTP